MRASDSLWPVLLLTTLVLSSGGALEAYARSHEADAVRIAVVGEAALPNAAPDKDDVDEDDPETSVPVSEAHALARALARRGELEQALELLAKVANDTPDALGPKLDLGYWLRQRGKISESLALLEQAQQAAPASVSAAFQLGASQRAAGKAEAADRKSVV